MAAKLQVHGSLGFTTLPRADLGWGNDIQILVASEATGQRNVKIGSLL